MFTFSTFIHAMNLALLPKVGRGMENKYFFAQNVSERKLCVVNKAHFAPKKVARLDSTLLRILCCFLHRKMIMHTFAQKIVPESIYGKLNLLKSPDCI